MKSLKTKSMTDEEFSKYVPPDFPDKLVEEHGILEKVQQMSRDNLREGSDLSVLAQKLSVWDISGETFKKRAREARGMALRMWMGMGGGG